MITCIYDYILKKNCMKCMILMHEIISTHASVVENSLIYSLPLMVTSVLEEI